MAISYSRDNRGALARDIERNYRTPGSSSAQVVPLLLAEVIGREVIDRDLSVRVHRERMRDNRVEMCLGQQARGP